MRKDWEQKHESKRVMARFDDHVYKSQVHADMVASRRSPLGGPSGRESEGGSDLQKRPLGLWMIEGERHTRDVAGTLIILIYKSTGSWGARARVRELCGCSTSCAACKARTRTRSSRPRRGRRGRPTRAWHGAEGRHDRLMILILI